MNDKHLHLEFKFTDRGGCDVYEIFNAEDDKRMQHPLGTARFWPADEGGYAPVSVIWLQEEPEECAPVQMELDL